MITYLKKFTSTRCAIYFVRDTEKIKENPARMAQHISEIKHC